MKIILFIALFGFLYSNSIKEYKAVFKCINFHSKYYVAIRSFELNSQKALLIVDGSSLKSGVILKESATDVKCSKELFESRYFKFLAHAKYESKHKLQNDGVLSSGGGAVLTTDLCPSSKEGFEDRLYLALIKRFKNPVPVTLFITKRWILKHEKAFEQLRTWQSEGKLNITWGNHTAEHIYHPKVELEHNFVLSREENLTKDILDLEQELLKRGIVPSVFFRFPGLVSDKKCVEMASNMGLIVIGADTWIAKGEKIKENSIILVHGNKNEPKGVDMLLKDLEDTSLKEPVGIDKIQPNIERNASKDANTTPIATPKYRE